MSPTSPSIQNVPQYEMQNNHKMLGGPSINTLSWGVKWSHDVAGGWEGTNLEKRFILLNFMYVKWSRDVQGGQENKFGKGKNMSFY